MFNDLIALFSGWYLDFVQEIQNAMSVSKVIVDESGSTTTETIVPEIWSAYVPWEQLIAAAVLITFLVIIFKLLRSVICRIS